MSTIALHGLILRIIFSWIYLFIWFIFAYIYMKYLQMNQNIIPYNINSLGVFASKNKRFRTFKFHSFMHILKSIILNNELSLVVKKRSSALYIAYIEQRCWLKVTTLHALLFSNKESNLNFEKLIFFLKKKELCIFWFLLNTTIS